MCPYTGVNCISLYRINRRAAAWFRNGGIENRKRAGVLVLLYLIQISDQGTRVTDGFQSDHGVGVFQSSVGLVLITAGAMMSQKE